MLDHSFNSTPFTIGIEEELMLLDPETFDLISGIELILADVPAEHEGQVQAELFQSVLEVSTTPCANVTEAVAELAEMRRLVCDIAGAHGMMVGAAGTHPFARCSDQRIVERDRYVELHAELGFIASRELIFGTHVHVGIDSPEKAIYIADGIRRHLPLMLALSANSPWWEGERTNLHSSRTPIFDQATRLEDTAAFAALTAALSHSYAARFLDGEPLVEQPWELIDDNKVRACIHGLEGELVDFDRGRPVPAREMAERLLDEVWPSAVELGCDGELARVREIITGGTGSRRQLDYVDERGGEDLRGLVEAVVALTA